MVKYLQLDGVDDNLQTGSITFDEVIMDFTPRQSNGNYYFDARTGIANAYFLRNSVGTDGTSASSPFWNGVYLNGTKIAGSTSGVIPSGQRITLRFVLSTAGTDDVSLFSQYNNVNHMTVDIYSIKFMLGGVVKAYYDMSTGTVQDQSGNSNHATLDGGTWLDDGTGGTPTGKDGTTTFDVRQSFYADSSLNVDTKQTLYSDGLFSVDSLINLYQDTNIQADTKQAIYSDSGTLFDTRQQMFRGAVMNADTKLILYQDASTLFDTLQEILNDGISGSVSFDLRQALYQDSQTAFDSKQAFYQDDAFDNDTGQLLYNAVQFNADTKQILYSDSTIKTDTCQSVYADGFTTSDTLIVIYDVDKQIIGTIRLQGKRVLDVQLHGKQELNVNLKGLIQ